MIILQILLAALATEALTQLAIHADILDPVRNKLLNLAKKTSAGAGTFFEKLLQCGYCFSMWAAWPALYIVFTPLEQFLVPSMLNIFFWTLIVHRLSNFIDDFADRYLRERDDLLDPNAYFSAANEQFNQEETIP